MTKIAKASNTAREINDVEIELGQWHWLLRNEKTDTLVCVTQIGSNYAEVENVSGTSWRIHFSEWFERTRPEHRPDLVIDNEVAVCQTESQRIMQEIQEVTRQIGMAPSQQDPGTTALATISGQGDQVASYKAALEKAKTDTLPALFEELELTHKSMAVWMKAKTLPLKAQVGAMQAAVAGIDDRIFSVSLYAGLAEEVTKIRGGKAAAASTKLHVMQRMAFMDEEALIGYEHGGMEFHDLGAFDRWLAKPENADRLLPHPRCMVAMQVRRRKKHRECDGSLASVWIKIQLEEADKKTFLLFRNGERLYRLSCDLDFDLMIFPNRNEFDMSEPVMVYAFGGAPSMDRDDDDNRRVARLRTMPRKTWEARKAEEEVREAASGAWEKAHPEEEWLAAELKSRRSKRLAERFAERKRLQAAGKSGFESGRRGNKVRVSDYDWRSANPHEKRNDRFSPDSWAPFDESYLYYDECMATIKQRVDYYNRVVLIIQGLFDRSEVFNPHPPAKLWDPAGFEAAITLVYDGEMTLYGGEAPNLDAYLAKNRASITKDSVLYNPDQVWAEREAEKENERRRHDRCGGSDRETFRPLGNPGPGELARPAKVSKKGRTATFTWFRERQRERSWHHRSESARDEARIETKIAISFDELFDVTEYEPGDYKVFFADPRTRETYLQWAHLFLTAEEYHQGNKKCRVQESNFVEAVKKSRAYSSDVQYCWMKKTKEDWTMEHAYCGDKKTSATSDLGSVSCPKCLKKAAENGFAE